MSGTQFEALVKSVMATDGEPLVMLLLLLRLLLLTFVCCLECAKSGDCVGRVRRQTARLAQQGKFSLLLLFSVV